MKARSDQELQPLGVTRAEIDGMDARALFGRGLERSIKGSTTAPATKLRVEQNDASAKVKFERDAASCEAELVKEQDGWKYRGETCQPGG